MLSVSLSFLSFHFFALRNFNVFFPWQSAILLLFSPSAFSQSLIFLQLSDMLLLPTNLFFGDLFYPPNVDVFYLRIILATGLLGVCLVTAPFIITLFRLKKISYTQYHPLLFSTLFLLFISFKDPYLIVPSHLTIVYTLF